MSSFIDNDPSEQPAGDANVLSPSAKKKKVSKRKRSTAGRAAAASEIEKSGAPEISNPTESDNLFG